MPKPLTRDRQHELFACLEFLVSGVLELTFLGDLLANQRNFLVLAGCRTPLGGQHA